MMAMNSNDMWTLFIWYEQSNPYSMRSTKRWYLHWNYEIIYTKNRIVLEWITQHFVVQRNLKQTTNEHKIYEMFIKWHEEFRRKSHRNCSHNFGNNEFQFHIDIHSVTQTHKHTHIITHKTAIIRLLDYRKGKQTKI